MTRGTQNGDNQPKRGEKLEASGLEKTAPISIVHFAEK
jgi:hypothetical protein